MRRALILALLLALAILVGCENMVAEAKAAQSDPSKFLGAIAGVGTTIGVLLFFFGHMTMMQVILNSLRLLGVICAIFGPLIYATSGNASYGFSVCLSGLIAMTVITFGFKKELDVVVKDDDDD